MPLFHVRAGVHEVLRIFFIYVQVGFETVFTLSRRFRQAPEYRNLETSVAAQIADDHYCVVLKRIIQLHICQWPWRIAWGRRYGSNAGLGEIIQLDSA